MALLFVPSVTMPFFSDDGSSENRELAEFPQLRGEDGSFNGGYTDELDSWISDHIGFRKLLAGANSAWQSKLFGKSAEESVIVGDDGWLFYAETESDFLNVATLSGRNINNIVRTLELMQEFAESHGAEFAVAVVPNKNTVYPEKMPYYYLPLDADGNLELLEAALADSVVNYADIRSAFSVADDILYQKTDSHWDYRGALLGYKTIMDSVEYPYNEFDGLTFEARTDWDGDLAGMLYADAAKQDVQYYPEYEFGYKIVSHETGVEAITLQTVNPNGQGKLIIFRDSFCNTMQTYLSESFAEATLSRAYPFVMDNVTKYDADVCVLEIVERNIPNLAKRAPVMQAPRAELSASAQPMKDGSIELYTETRSGYVHLYGTIDGDYLGDAYRVYILTGTGGSASAYEAFPIFEQELLYADELSDNGFSAYLGGKLWGSVETVSIIVESDGVYYISGAYRDSDIQ